MKIIETQLVEKVKELSGLTGVLWEIEEFNGDYRVVSRDRYLMKRKVHLPTRELVSAINSYMEGYEDGYKTSEEECEYLIRHCYTEK